MLAVIWWSGSPLTGFGPTCELMNYNFQPEVDNDVISSMALDNASMDVLIKFGESRSNGFWDIRGADFVSKEHGKAYANSTKHQMSFALKWFLWRGLEMLLHHRCAGAEMCIFCQVCVIQLFLLSIWSAVHLSLLEVPRHWLHKCPNSDFRGTCLICWQMMICTSLKNKKCSNVSLW